MNSEPETKASQGASPGTPSEVSVETKQDPKPNTWDDTLQGHSLCPSSKGFRPRIVPHTNYADGTRNPYIEVQHKESETEPGTYSIGFKIWDGSCPEGILCTKLHDPHPCMSFDISFKWDKTEPDAHLFERSYIPVRGLRESDGAKTILAKPILSEASDSNSVVTDWTEFKGPKVEYTVYYQDDNNESKRPPLYLKADSFVKLRVGLDGAHQCDPEEDPYPVVDSGDESDEEGPSEPQPGTKPQAGTEPQPGSPVGSQVGSQVGSHSGSHSGTEDDSEDHDSRTSVEDDKHSDEEKEKHAKD